MTSLERPPLLLFGATTASGAACLELAAQRRVLVAGRNRPMGWPSGAFLPCDLEGPPPPLDALPGGSVLVSFAPIWSLAPFLRALLGQAPGGAGEAFGAGRLAAVVACSSSSVLTKRFAANRSDRRLVERLSEAETSVEASAQEAGIPCHILRPTLIYGQAGSYGDRNLSRLIHWMGRLPLLPIPADTGLRQPIHARQLAAVALHLADNAGGGPARVAIGGDTCLSYAAMLQQLQRAAALVDPQHPASRCRLLPLPNRLFQLLAAPLLPLSAKGFEAVLRIQANLGPFAKAHELLGVEPEAFPVSPLAMGNRPTPVSSLDAPPEP